MLLRLQAFASVRGVSTIWGFPKIRGTILGVPIVRILVGSILGSLYFGKLPLLGRYRGFGFRGGILLLQSRIWVGDVEQTDLYTADLNHSPVVIR